MTNVFFYLFLALFIIAGIFYFIASAKNTALGIIIKNYYLGGFWIINAAIICTFIYSILLGIKNQNASFSLLVILFFLISFVSQKVLVKYFKYKLWKEVIRDPNLFITKYAHYLNNEHSYALQQIEKDIKKLNKRVLK